MYHPAIKTLGYFVAGFFVSGCLFSQFLWNAFATKTAFPFPVAPPPPAISSQNLKTIVSSANRSDLAYGINMIDTHRYYSHASVFNEFDENALFAVSPEFVTEFNGLKYSVHYDCDHSKAFRDHHNYYQSVPDRWTQCEYHNFLVTSHFQWAKAPLPIIDEEYFEHIDVYEAVQRHCQNRNDESLNAYFDDYHFDWVFAELGSRWAPWAFRSISAHLNMQSCKANTENGNLKMLAIAFEPEPRWCPTIAETVKLNDFSQFGAVVESECLTAFATVESLFNVSKSYAEKVSPKKFIINYLSVDIQGSEESMFDATNFVDRVEFGVFLNETVAHISVGTHSGTKEKYGVLLSYFMDYLKWTPVTTDDPGGKITAGGHYIVSHLRLEKNFSQILKDGKYEATEFGPILSWDGNIILSNPNIQ